MPMSNFLNPYYIIILLYITVFGLCFGSFLNVVILRGLSGESFLFSRSKCPKCGKRLCWYMNIPIFSYIFLKGKCAFCKNPISVQYPIIEALTAVLFLISFIYFGFNLKAIFMCAFFFMFLALCVTDIKQKVIIDYHAYILAFLGLIYSCFDFSNINIFASIIGGITGFLVLEIIARIAALFAGERAFGEGDSLITLGLGTIFGFKDIILIIAFAILIQGLLALPVLSYGAIKNNNKKLCYSYILTGFALIYLLIANIFKLENYTTVYTISVILLAFALIWALKNILNSIKERNLKANGDDYQTNLSFLPFGPALISASFICIFYMDKIKQIISAFL